MQFTDLLPTFLSDIGRPLANGRLVFYKLGDTDLADIYSDRELSTPLVNPLALNSAGRTDQEVYLSEDVTVHVEEYVGLDELNQELFESVKIFDVFVTGSGVSPINGLEVIENIADLKGLVPVDKLSVMVLGYLAIGDCPSRVFTYNLTNNEIENSGTVFESALTSNGRWLWVPDTHEIDARTFGVIPGVAARNSAFRAVQDYCASEGKITLFTKGTYQLNGGASYDANGGIRVEAGVVFNATSTYTYNLRNPNVEIESSFAGTNFVFNTFSITNEWGKTRIPTSAWGSNSIPNSLADNISLVVNNNVTLSGSYEFKEIEILDTQTLSLALTGATYAQVVFGSGKISLTAVPTHVLETKELFADMFTTAANRARFLQLATQTRFIVRSDISIYDAAIFDPISVNVPFEIRKGIVDNDNTLIISSNFSCISNSLDGIYAFREAFDVDWFISGATGAAQALNSFAFGSYPEADFKGFNIPTTLSKSGSWSVKNLTVERIINAETIHLENVVVNYSGTNPNGAIDADQIFAKNCTFRSPTGETITRADYVEFENVVLGTTNEGLGANILSSGRFINITAEGSTLGASIECNGNLKIDNSRFFNVTARPNDENILQNVDISNSDLYAINLSSTTATSGATANRIKIENNRLRATFDIYAAGENWAVGGHYSVVIQDNWNTTANRSAKATVYQGWVVANSVINDAGGYPNFNLVTLDTSDIVFFFNNGTGILTLPNPRNNIRLGLQYGYARLINNWPLATGTSDPIFPTITEPLIISNGDLNIYVKQNVPGITLGLLQPDNTNPWQYNLNFRVYP